MQKIFIIIIAILIALLIFNRHKNIYDFEWKCEIFADQSGYYVYLPSAIIYNFTGEKMPDNIVQKTGNGFKISSDNKKIITKYTYGIALLQLPFFLFIHCLALLGHLNPDGFSHIYQEVPNISAWIYTVLAFLLGFKILSKFFSEKITIICLLVVFLSTNWFYYSIDSTGMSHCYSAFLIILELYLLNMNSFNKYSIFRIAIASFVAGLIVLIRPINILCLPIIYLLSRNEFNLRHVISYIQTFPSRLIFGMFCPFVLAFIPQFLYWKYAYGSYLFYSYGDEGFVYKFNPQLFHLWFAPANGLVLYNPIYILFIIIFILFIKSKFVNGIYIAILFFIMSYVYSSWHAVSYGCSFGQRNYVDLSIFWCLTIGFSFNVFKSLSTITRILITKLVIILTCFNLYLIYNYNTCFFSTTWDYTEYFYYFSKNWHKQYSNLSNEVAIMPGNEFYRVHQFAKECYNYKLKYAKVNCEILNLKDSINSLVRFELLNKDEIIFSSDNNLSNNKGINTNWESKEFIFEFPKTEHRENNYRLVFCNSSLKDNYKVRNINIELY